MSHASFLGFLLLICLKYVSTSVAWGSDFETGGRAAFSFSGADRLTTSDLDKEAVLDLETRRKRGYRAGLDVRISSDSGTVTLRELYLEREFENQSRFQLGQHRKRFGLDWDRGLEDRVALNRAPVYETLARLGYVGRDTLVRFYQQEINPWSHDVSIHTSDGLNVAGLYGLKLRINESTYIASFTLFQVSRVDNQNRPSLAQALSMEHRQEPVRWELEAIVGQDYLEADRLRRSGRGREVVFSSVHAAGAVRWSEVEPFARASLIITDLVSQGGVFSGHLMEGTFGARYYFLPSLYLGVQIQGFRPAAETRSLASLRYFF